ncbi:hypothetical protein GQ43DRAFT_466094 [Delitschia confertaspora ATCC 74209]|uniref:C2H2-type domain-containing protein n=1 Tax=Delitschia confertaspora ATCC 74209 TaxID=1513339 RepID=A0A9P4JEA6_9PLEO|nr:hypothetical protein GQ43DRAFT_466094 [Delitschia confertaspora ATCC 74209]
MFADNAFLKPDLTDGLTPENIYQLDIRPGCNVLKLLYKLRLSNPKTAPTARKAEGKAFVKRREELGSRAGRQRYIQQQLLGVKFSDRIKTNLKRSPDRTAQHNRLIECVMSLPGSSLKEEAPRRSAAINAIVAYCHIEEGRTRRVQRATGLVKYDETVRCDAVNPLVAALEAAKVSVYKEKRPTICFMCLGNEKSPIEKRIYSFRTSGDLSKHFKLRHLAKIKGDKGVGCDLCHVPLDDKMHLQRHAYDIHGTVS